MKGPVSAKEIQRPSSQYNREKGQEIREKDRRYKIREKEERNKGEGKEMFVLGDKGRPLDRGHRHGLQENGSS